MPSTSRTIAAASCVRPSAPSSSHRDRFAVQAGLQLLRRALDDDLAAADDGHPLREPVGLLQVVRGEQDGQILLHREAFHLDPHGGPRLGVEAGGRLVEEEHPRLVHEPERDVEAALHPAGVAARDAIGGVGEAEQLEQLVHALVQRRACHRVDPALQQQVLAAGRLPVDAGVLRDVADQVADAVRMRGRRPRRRRAPFRSPASSASSARGRRWTCRRRSARAARRPRPRARRTRRRRAPGRSCSACAGPRRRSRPRRRV